MVVFPTQRLLVVHRIWIAWLMSYCYFLLFWVGVIEKCKTVAFKPYSKDRGMCWSSTSPGIRDPQWQPPVRGDIAHELRWEKCASCDGEGSC